MIVVHKLIGLVTTAAILGTVLSAVMATNTYAAYSGNLAGATSFANDFCSNNHAALANNGISVGASQNLTYGIADMLWVTATDGTQNITVNPNVTQVTVKVQSYVRICDNSVTAMKNPAGQTTNYFYRTSDVTAYDVKSFTKGGDINSDNGRLAVGPSELKYNFSPTNPSGLIIKDKGSTLSISNSYDAVLEVGDWKSGDNSVCISFKTRPVSGAPAGSFSFVQSPSPCTTIKFTRLADWSVSGKSMIGVNHAPNVSSYPSAPGDVLDWQHVLTNGGPDTSPSVAFAVGKTGFSNGWNSIIDPQGSVALGGGKSKTIGYGGSPTSYSKYTVRQRDVGNTLCESISWGPSSWNKSAWSASNTACSKVPYNFTLTPTKPNAPSVAESGGNFKVSSGVTNSGPTKSYPDTEWRVIRFVLDKGVAPKPGTTNTTDPCGYFGGKDCKPVTSGVGGTGILFSPDGPVKNVTGSENVPVGDLPSGSQLCFATSVTKYTVGKSSPSDWSHSAVTCVTIGKKPKVQAWGGDVRVGGKIETSVSSAGGSVYGSWGEYGVFSTKVNTNLASGAGLAKGSISDTQSGWSNITFANKPSFGNYGALPVQTLTGQFTGLASEPLSGGTIDDVNMLSAVTPTKGVYKATGNITLKTSQIQKGLIINATGRTVTIEGDITYKPGSYTSTANLPQLVIIAQNIYIKQGVTDVDAWLLASGVIDTCSDIDGAPGTMPVSTKVLTNKTCDKLLTVHGPVATNKLVLKRTRGADTTTRTDASEVFNLRSDAYLWAQARATASGQVRTVYSAELPPRF